jgi:hypothetical protein
VIFVFFTHTLREEVRHVFVKTTMSAAKRKCPIEKMVRLEMAKFARVRPATYDMNLPLSRII